MKDELEDFVKDNRRAFDDRAPSARVWRRIAAATGLSRPRNPVNAWRAAAIFFMATSVALLLQHQAGNMQSARVAREFSDVEAFYHQEILNRVRLIGEFQGNAGLNGFTNDFQQLEAMYQVLKEEMRDRPTPQVRDALVLNLLVRIDLLNQHIERLEKEEGQQAAADNRST